MDQVVTAIRSVAPKGEADNIVRLNADGAELPEVKEWIPSGIQGIDRILGGGWPVGRSSEVYGPAGAGKSAMMHMAVKQTQMIGGNGIIFDFEHAFDARVVKQLDIDPKRLLVLHPQCAEEMIDYLWATIDKIKEKPPEHPVFIGVDSVAAMATRAELDAAKAEDIQVAPLARLLSKHTKRLYYDVARCRMHLMFLNQERTVIGTQARFKPKQTVGGATLDYATSQRVRSTVYQLPKSGKPKVGLMANVKTDKNRLAPPFQTAQYVIDFHYGPSFPATLLWIFIENKIIKSAGGGKYKMSGYKTTFKKSHWVQLYNEPKRKKLREVALRHYSRLLDDAAPPVPGYDDEYDDGADE